LGRPQRAVVIIMPLVVFGQRDTLVSAGLAFGVLR
jgi:hypothetical protein